MLSPVDDAHRKSTCPASKANPTNIFVGSIACAQSIAQTCPENNSLCYSLNIPAATTSSNNGPIYFQMMAPTAMQWVGLGQGTRMAGANIFVMYSSADGNVTVRSANSCIRGMKC